MSFTERSDDIEAIKSVIEGLSDAWEEGNGAGWGQQFTEDADFTGWFGLRLQGRREIAEGHQWVFDTVYPGSRYELEIADIRFLSSDIAILHLNGSIIEPGETHPDEPDSLPVAVVQKDDGEWKVVMFHNMKNRREEIDERGTRGDLGDIRE